MVVNGWEATISHTTFRLKECYCCAPTAARVTSFGCLSPGLDPRATVEQRDSTCRPKKSFWTGTSFILWIFTHFLKIYILINAWKPWDCSPSSFSGGQVGGWSIELNHCVNHWEEKASEKLGAPLPQSLREKKSLRRKILGPSLPLPSWGKNLRTNRYTLET